MSDNDRDNPARNRTDPPDPRAMQVVTLRLRCRTWGEISAELNIDPSTLFRLRQKYELDQVVAQYQNEVVAAAQEEYARAGRLTFKVIADSLASDNAKDRRWAAARMLEFLTARGESPRAQVSANQQGTTRAPMTQQQLRAAARQASKKLSGG